MVKVSLIRVWQNRWEKEHSMLRLRTGTQKCLLVESGILGFEIRAQGIRNPSKYWNQESKTFLDYLIWGLSPPQRRGSKGHGASDCGNPKTRP